MAAKKALFPIFRPGYDYAKAGILLSRFTNEATKQYSLFKTLMSLRKTLNLMRIYRRYSMPHEDTDLFCITEYIPLLSHAAELWSHQNILPAGMNYLKQTEYLKSRIT